MAQVTGQAWPRAMESKGSGVRGTGQGSTWERAIYQLFTRDCCPDELGAQRAFWVSCASMLILEIVLHQNFLIRLLGNFSADADYQARSCHFFSVMSGKKWKNISSSCTQRHARFFHFYAKEREKETMPNNKTKRLFVIFFLQGFIHLFLMCSIQGTNGRSFTVRGHRNPCAER